MSDWHEDQIAGLKKEIEAAKAIIVAARQIYEQEHARAKRAESERNTAYRALDEVERNLSEALGGATGNTPQLVDIVHRVHTVFTALAPLMLASKHSLAPRTPAYQAVIDAWDRAHE